VGQAHRRRCRLARTDRGDPSADGKPIRDLTYDSSRIRRELSYREHVPQDEALRRTVGWELAHPPETIDPKRDDYAAADAVLASFGDQTAGQQGAGSWIGVSSCFAASEVFRAGQAARP
jgi:hypothetical protein